MQDGLNPTDKPFGKFQRRVTMKRFSMNFRTTVGLLGTAATLALMPTAAHATEGYFQNGVSARDKGVAGAVVADTEGPLAIASNPAGIAEGEDAEATIGASVFMPDRSYTGSGGPGFTGTGEVESDSKVFVLPSLGARFPLDDKSAIAVAIFGNGGMNTTYPNVANPACVSPPLPASSGTFCGGAAGVNLMQAYVSVGYARQFGDHINVGIAPVLGVQMFRAKGLAAFGQVTSDPANFTNRGNDTSTGLGLRVGVLVKFTPQVRLGASYQTKMNMSKFDKYAGLFADDGDFDIPSSYSIGLAVDPMPGVTVMGEYRRINYTDVGSVSNASTVQLPLGAAGGPGFGWKDVNTYKFGLEAQASEGLTLRLGASFNNNPVTTNNVTLNILAPGVSKTHLTAGARIATGARSGLDLSVMYSPRSKVSGIEVTPQGPNPGHLIELGMNQLEIAVGWTFKL